MKGKVIEVMWFSAISEHIGIVLYINESGVKKAYIRSVAGHGQETDIRHIVSNGAKLHVQQAEKIFNHLKT